MIKINLFTIVICLFIIYSCKKDDQSISLIEPDFQEYVDRFKAEAISRDFIIDLSELKVTYEDTMKAYCGCGMPNHVIINSSCWEKYTDAQKEILIFHEIGHSILRRNHDISKLQNGDFKTIMNPFPFYLYTESTPDRRKYYVDELFIQSTPPPEWVIIKTIPTIIFKDTIQSDSPLWQFVNQSGNSFIGKFCSTQYNSAGSSLSIEPSNNLKGWAYWQLNITPQGIKQSDKLVLSARIKTVGVTKGGGVTLLMRGFDVNNDILFFTYKTDSGTMDFTEWKVELPYYFSSKSMHIRFVLDRSKGITYLDDVTLTKYE